MLIGKYDVDSLNDGRHSIRWLDRTSNTYKKHIFGNLEELLTKLIKEESKAKDTSEVIRHYTMYCTNPVEFLMASDNHFVEHMRDRWCYNETSFVANIIDFVQAYNQAHDTAVSHPEIVLAVADLEESWKISWQGQPMMEDLMKSGFLEIDLTDGYA